MARPTELPFYATDPVMTSGPESGSGTRVRPSNAILQQGMPAGARGAARYLSWVLGTICDWLKYNDEKVLPLQAQNWPERASIGAGGAANTDLSIAWGSDAGYSAGGIWVILEFNTIFVSYDGRKWTSPASLTQSASVRPEIAVGKVDGITTFFANGGFVNKFYTSTDGLSWTLRSTGPGGDSTQGKPCYASSLNRWILVSTAVYYTPGTAAGIAGVWTNAASVPSSWSSNSGGCRRVVWNGSLFVATPVNNYNKFLTSPDGITWTERTLVASTWTALAYSPYDGLWMAIGQGAGVYTSTDGITWTFVTTALPTINDLAALGPLWVATCTNGSYGGISYSVNKGVTWVNGTVGNHDVATAGWLRIVSADNRFMVGHVDGTNIEIAMSSRATP